MNGRPDVAQVAHRRLDGAGQRLALVDVERAAVVEHHAEIVVAAEGVIPRRPVDQHWRLVGNKRHAAADHRLVGAQHQLRVDHAFRLAGRARGEENFCDGFGADFGVRGFDRGGRRRSAEVGEQRRLAVRRRISRDGDLDILSHRRGDRAGKRRAVGGEDKTRRENVDDGFEFLEILREQRVRHRDRRIRNADMHGGKANERMLDVVAGQNRDRPLGR